MGLYVKFLIKQVVLFSSGRVISRAGPVFMCLGSVIS